MTWIRHRIAPRWDSDGKPARVRRRPAAVDQGCHLGAPARIAFDPGWLVPSSIRAQFRSQVKDQANPDLASDPLEPSDEGTTRLESDLADHQGKERSHERAAHSCGYAHRAAARFDRALPRTCRRPVDLAALVGQPVDIAPSAYVYRADRSAERNPPESWLLLMQYANLPLNQPVAVNHPALGQVLCGLLWEEVRPVRKVELSWSEGQAARPTADDLVLAYFDATDGIGAYVVEPSNHQGSGQARGFARRPYVHVPDPRRHLGRGGARRESEAGLRVFLSDDACPGSGRVEDAGDRGRMGVRRGDRAPGP